MSAWHAAYTLARRSADQGRLDDARAYCWEAIARAHIAPEPHYLMATLCEATGDHAGALSNFRKALYVDPEFVPAYLGLASLHRRTGQANLAHRDVARARRLLEGRPADELVLAAEGLTVGHVRRALDRGLAPRLNGNG